MVSQPDHRYRASSLTLRGGASSGSSGTVPPMPHATSTPTSSHHYHHAPSSVVSAAASGTRGSRSRRYQRSLVGGTSYAPLNEFPVFTNTGDVEILVRVRSGHENRYLLHRDTLARCSGFFEASTSKEWSRGGSIGELEGSTSLSGDEVARVGAAAGAAAGGGSSSNGNSVSWAPGAAHGAANGANGANAGGSTSSQASRRRWRYELDLGEDENDKPILVQKEETSMASAAATPTAASVAAAQSLFGGPTSHSRSGASSGGSASRPSKSSGGPPFSNPSFFRSMANLAMPHSSSSSAYAPSSHRHRRDHSYGRGDPYASSVNLHHHGAQQQQQQQQQLLPPPSPEDVDLLRDYDNLFRIMYNYAPVLDNVNIADAYVQCKSLLAVADEYDALAVVGPRVDHHLLQFQSRLWRQIAKYPISYLRLGYHARSRVIFQEALVHVVGQWPAGERSLRAALPISVLDLIEDKVDELAEAVARIEASLFRLHLTTRGGERVSPSTAYLDWLAMSLFRQWLAENTTPAAAGPAQPPAVPGRQSAYGGGHGSGGHHRSGGHGHSSSRHGRHSSSRHHARNVPSSESSASSTSTIHDDRALMPATANPSTALTLHVRTTVIPPLVPPLSSLGRTYRTLGTAAGPSFLGHDECKRFLKLSPDLYSRDNLRRFEKRIDELKAMAREIVRPLMGSGLELELSSSGAGSGSGGSGRHYGGSGGIGPGEYITYFTCTYVDDRDLPWLLEM